MLKDKELRKTIGSRAKSRRQELGLNQPYVAEKMGVTFRDTKQERLITPRK